MSHDYPLTLQDVAAFLATKHDEDVLGICFNAMYCLLSETLNWLYPEMAPWRADIGSYATYSRSSSIYRTNHDRALTILQSTFDYCLLPARGVVTKEKLRNYLEHLEFDEEVKRKMPFTTRDLFPE